MQSQSFIDAWNASTHLLSDRLLIRDWPDDLPWHSIAPELLKREAHLLPAILRLDELGPEQREEVQLLLAMTDPVKVAPAMLLGSHLDTEALARRLASHTTVTLSDESQVLLRFADPQVFIHLLWILPSAQLASLCNGTQLWSMPALEQWHELQFVDRPRPVWGALGEDASIALVNVGLINDIMATLPAPYNLQEIWHTGEQCNRWLRVAQGKIGLSDAADCAAFARHGVLFGDGFADHPALAPHLQTARETPGAYAQQTASIPQREWERIAAEIRLSNQKGNAP